VIAPGTRIGVYEIRSMLGAGGMGEVYRARDTKLERDVAIKVLPQSVAGDPERLSRFEREARLLASLNHPNIASIYGFEDTAGVPALILELVEGRTLADLLAHPGTRPGFNEAIDIARQIAAALEAAHDRGIIHRDLKPANVKRTTDGAVKVLDFGLAKALADDAETTPELSHSPTVTVAGTRGGVILGTAAYMSPEQARGQPLDERTDIWSFGCTLFELITGQAAFGGPTVSDIVVRVLSGEPDWSALPASTSPTVRRLLRRCLEKDRRRRLHAIADARLEIEDALAGPDQSGTSAIGAPFDPWRWLGWVVAAAATIAVAFAMLAGARRASDEPLVEMTPEPLTHDAGLAMTPAISADGRLVAYASDRAGRGDLDIWVQQISGGSPLRLTTDPADEQAPDFSPDGSQIVFRSERDGGGVYIVSALGGEPRLIAREGRRPRFSPDGSRVAYWVGLVRGGANAPSATYVIALAGGAPARLLADFAVARDPIWSPDGRGLLVSARRTRESDELDWWRVPADGAEPVRTDAARLPAVKASLVGPPAGYQWVARDILFSGGGSLWSLPMSTDGRISGAIHRITLGVEQLRDPTKSRDGKIVAASATFTRVIERVALSGRDESTLPVRLYADNRPGDGRASQTADGSILVWPRNGEIWTKDLRTGKERFVLRAESRTPVNATVSPDGARIAYSADKAGYVVETSGGVPQRVCDRCDPYGFLSDGRRLLLARGDDGPGPLRVVDSVTTSMEDLIASASNTTFDRPHASPNDRWLAFRRQIANQGKTFVAPLRPGSPPLPGTWRQVDEPTVSGRPTGWSLDSHVLYLLLDTDGFRCLWGQRVDDNGQLIGKPYAVRHFHGASESNFGTSDGNAIAAGGFMYEGTRRSGNIWMLAPSGSNR